MQETVRAFIGIGSNLAEPEQQILQAVRAMQQLPQSHLVLMSSVYRSLPMGPADQPDYVNAVAALDTQLSAQQLLQHTQRIELEQGRERKDERWGPRTLDLDILLYGMQQIVSEHLTIPHYGIAKREFVLYPLAEIAPAASIPGHGMLETLLQSCPLNGLQKLNDTVEFQTLRHSI